MMQVLVVLAHPDKNSFNHAIARTAVKALSDNKHEVIFHDLYDEGFDPVLWHEEIPRDSVLSTTLQQHCSELAAADGIIVVHPNWWGQPPAILTGWIDRVVRPGVGYEFLEGDNGEGVPVGLLNAKCAAVFNTSNTPEERERSAFGDPLQLIWKNCIFDLCGVKSFERKIYRVVVASTPEQRQTWLQDVQATVSRLFPK